MSLAIGNKLEIRTVEWQAAVAATAETTAILPVKKGDIVLAAHMITRIEGSATAGTSTVELGDGGDTDRFIVATDLEGGTVGAYAAGVTANFPHLYTSDDTIDVKYTPNASQANQIAVRMVVVILKTANV